MVASVAIPPNGMIKVKFLSGVARIVNPSLFIRNPVFSGSAVVSDVTYTEGLADDVPTVVWRTASKTFLPVGTFIEFDLKHLKMATGWPVYNFFFGFRRKHTSIRYLRQHHPLFIVMTIVIHANPRSLVNAMAKTS